MEDIIIYTLWLSILIVTTRLSLQIQNRSSLLSKAILYFSLLIHSLIIGHRFNVGVDWQGYVDDYYQIIVNPFRPISSYYELGYYTLNWVSGYFNLGYTLVFSVCAFLSWWFIFKSCNLKVLPLILFMIFVDEYHFWGMNGVRQFLSITIFLFSIRYIESKEFVKFILLIILAGFFHSSAFILFIFYFLPLKKMFDKIPWLTIFIPSIALIFLLNLSNISKILETAIIVGGENSDYLSRYSRYATTGRITSQDNALGLGFLFKILINSLIFILSTKIAKTYPETKIYFVLFFIGAIFFNIFYDIQIINRFLHYFIFIRVLLGAYLIRYLWLIDKSRILALLFILSYFLVYIAAIDRNSNMCCPFQLQFF